MILLVHVLIETLGILDIHQGVFIQSNQTNYLPNLFLLESGLARLGNDGGSSFDHFLVG